MKDNVIKDLANILKNEGLELHESCSVGNGDINAAVEVKTNKGRFFIKLNSANNYAGMFIKEAEGLRALEKAHFLRVPKVIATGEFNGQQYLILEWLKKVAGGEGTWESLAKGLAQLHRISNPCFGWQSHNYIGSLLQSNNYTSNWSEFYASQRILPFIKKLFNDKKFDKTMVAAAERLCNKLDNLFPLEAPSLVHGDLWAGNFMSVEEAGEDSTKKISAAIFDPAVYYGHRELDLGMTLLFGGFDKTFYDYYHAYFPLEKNWRQRVPVTQLYPLLVHAVLFAGSYVSRCMNILNKWA